MSNKNAVGDTRKFWGVIPVIDGEAMLGMAKQCEDMGYEGLFAIQVYGPPFVPLAVAAAATKKLKIASGIAIAAARSPFETAMAAIDLDRISNGRFILGLGTSAAGWTSGVYGAPNYKPITHMRDTVDAVRYIIKGSHKGLQPYDGTYYKADFELLKPTDPPLREEIPIWVAGLREKLVRVGCEIGEGVIGHPVWSVEWAVNEMGPVISDELQKQSRKRDEIEVSIWPFMAINDDEQEAINEARATVAFYSGVKQYEPFFEAHGFGKEARACQTGVQAGGDIASIVHHVPDEMVKTFVACGSRDKVLERIEPLWGMADSLCPAPPLWLLPPERVQYYAGNIAEMIGGQLSS